MLFFWKLAATSSIRSQNPEQDQVIPLPSVRLETAPHVDEDVTFNVYLSQVDKVYMTLT